MKVSFKSALLGVMLIGGLIVLPDDSFADSVVGRWCDKPLAGVPALNGVMEIVVIDDDRVELRVSYGDGSSKVTKLTQESATVYAEIDNQFGQKYKIVSSDGNLQLLDQDGLIRVTVRLENTKQEGECS